MCLTRHRVSKCAQHNGLDKLSIQNLKIRVTRYPCGSRDKAESRPDTKLPVSINSVLSEAKQTVELHRERAHRVLTLQFGHCNENPIIYLTGEGAGRLQ